MRIDLLRAILTPAIAVLGIACLLPNGPALAEPSASGPTAYTQRAGRADRDDVTATAFATPRGKPDVRSSAALVVDETDSTVLYAKQPKLAVPVASITKLMTALVVLEGGQSLEELVTITQQDRDTKYGSGSRLAVGWKLRRGDLLRVALMSSDNRAAHALGRTYPGGMTAFVHAMNAKARALGMNRSRFVDPTGLSSKNVSTAEDLSRLVIAASHDETIHSYSTGKNYLMPVGKQQLEFRNTNLLVGKPDWEIAVQKTGYTAAAGQCLVMKAMIQDRPIVIVLLNSFGKYTRVADARRIRRWMESAAQSTQLARASR